MLTIILYTFSKKFNSTKQVNIEGTSQYCTLKANTSLLSPEIEIQGTASLNPTNKNYAYIADFKRYYFINDWTYFEGVWTAHMTVDVLASYKVPILATSQYVLRSASKYDGRVVDTIYPAKASPVFAVTTGTMSNWTFMQGNLCIVVGVVNGGVYSLGGIVYYALTPEQFSDLRSYLLQGVDAWDEITDLSGDIAKAFIDPFQYIVSAMVFPFPASTVGSNLENIRFGFWESTVQGLRLAINYGYDVIDLARPVYPFTERGYWQYIMPYAEYYLYSQPWGVIPIDGTSINGDGVHLNIVFDYITGIATMEIFRKSDLVKLDAVTCQLGVQIQISQITTDYMGAVSSLGGAIGSIVGAGVSALDSFFGNGDTAAIASAAQASLAKVNISGTSTGFGALFMSNGQVRFTAKYFEPVGENLEHLGRPLCATTLLSTLSGYCICADGDVAIDGTEEEQREINSFLTGGFFIE